MEKADAIKKAGSGAALARLLGITRQAVEKWERIPPLQVYRLREKKPHWFRSERRKAQA